MFSILTLIFNFLGGSVLQKLVDAYKLRLQSMTTTEAKSVELAEAEILAEVAARQAATQLNIVEQGRWYTAAIRPSFAYPLAVYYAWVIVTCLFHWTPPAALPVPLDVWSGWIITSYFVGRSFEKGVRIFRGWKNTPAGQ
jgi:hypothetical protein